MSSAQPARRNVFEDPSVLDLTMRQSKEVLPALLAFLAEHKPHVGQILMGNESGRWTQRDLRRLENLIIKKTIDPRTERDFLRVLRKACAFWVVRERLNLALPRIPVLAPEPKNPFRGNLPKMLERYAAWKHVLQTWLRALTAVDRFEQHNDSGPAIEMLIVSAVLYGGLHNMPSLLALVRAVPEADSRTFCTDGRIHIELSLSCRGIQNMELRRWQPDALTATLWARVRPEAVADLLQPLTDNDAGATAPDKDLAKQLDRLVRVGLERSSASNRGLLGGIDRLLRVAQTVAHIELPAILAAYASRKLVSHSLRRDGLQRLSKEPISVAVNPQSLSTTSLVGSVSYSLAGPPRLSEDLEPAWLKQLRVSMRAEDSDDLRDELAKMGRSNETSPFARRMADFCDSLLVVRSAGGKMRNVNSAKRVVIELAQYMGPFLDGQDPANLNTETLETVYVQMLESTGQLPEGATIKGDLPPVSKKRRNLSRVLMEFHRYMIARHGKEAIEDKGLLTARAGLVAVDANLLTLEDYFATLNEIENTWPAADFPERKKIARILVILGFRCGLRRLEALHLFIRDLLLGAQMELLIRPSEGRTLKSRNARRRLPLRVLLTESELEEVLAWRNARISDQGSATSDCLFGNVRENLDVVPQAILEQINQILRRVTGDETMHFHQLRHSFATWTWLRLMLADMKNPPVLFPHLKMTTVWLLEGSAFRKKIYRHDRPTRKHAYLLAQQLGHGSPSTSMEHYVHLLDWLLAVCLGRSKLMHPKNEFVALATGRPRTTIQRWGSNEQSMAVPLKLWTKRTSKQRSVKKTKPPQDQSAPGRRNWVWSGFDYLRAADKGDLSLDEICKEFQMDEAIGRRLLGRARYLRDLSSGNGADRHRMEMYTPDLRNPKQRRVLACPSGAEDPVDKQVVERFSGILERLTHNQPSLVESALYSYVHRVWRSRGLVVFHSPAEANDVRAYVEFLTELGIARKDIRWFSFSKVKRSKYLAEWKRILGLNRHNRIERLRPPNSKADAAEAWLGIALCLNEYIEAKNSKSPGAFGFRFLMLMAFIVFGGN